MNWKYDYYNCPDDPDTGVPACGDLPECKSCEWYHLITSAQKCTTTETKKQRVIRKRITLCFLVKPFLHKFGVNVVSNQPNRVDKRRGINAF